MDDGAMLSDKFKELKKKKPPKIEKKEEPTQIVQQKCTFWDIINKATSIMKLIFLIVAVAAIMVAIYKLSN